QGDPGVMPARMRRTAARGSSAQFDGRSGVGSSREVKPIAEHNAVVGEPDDWRSNNGCARKPEGARAKSAGAHLLDADRGPAEQSKDPAVIPSENCGDENQCDVVKQTCGSARIVLEALTPFHHPDREPDH